MKKKFFALPYIVWMILFTVMPLILVLVYAFFNTTPSGDVIFTTEYLASAFSPESLSVLWRSLGYALITTVLCLLIAYPGGASALPAEAPDSQHPEPFVYPPHVDEFSAPDLCLAGASRFERPH